MNSARVNARRSCFFVHMQSQSGELQSTAEEKHTPLDYEHASIYISVNAFFAYDWPAADMHNHGFEWTFKYGWPQNLDTKRYRLQPKCCSLRYAQGIYRCNHTWEPLMDLPIGDPITGKAWTKARPDTGTYKGGTVF